MTLRALSVGIANAVHGGRDSVGDSGLRRSASLSCQVDAVIRVQVPRRSQALGAALATRSSPSICTSPRLAAPREQGLRCPSLHDPPHHAPTGHARPPPSEAQVGDTPPRPAQTAASSRGKRAAPFVTRQPAASTGCEGRPASAHARCPARQGSPRAPAPCSA